VFQKMPQGALQKVPQGALQKVPQEVFQKMPQKALQQRLELFGRGDFARQTKRVRYQRLISKSCTA
jgi:hypothetical protein